MKGQFVRTLAHVVLTPLYGHWLTMLVARVNVDSDWRCTICEPTLGRTMTSHTARGHGDSPQYGIGRAGERSETRRLLLTVPARVY